jgi:hypothetical protein
LPEKKTSSHVFVAADAAGSMSRETVDGNRELALAFVIYRIPFSLLGRQWTVFFHAQERILLPLNVQDLYSLQYHASLLHVAKVYQVEDDMATEH